MNTFKVVKIFTIVLVFITGLSSKAQNSPAQQYAACLRNNCATKVNAPPVRQADGTYSGGTNEYSKCVDSCAADRDAAAGGTSASDCRSALNSIDDKKNQAAQECSKSGVDYNTCVAKAKSCGGSMNTDGSDVSGAIQNIIGAMQATGTKAACFTDVAAEQTRQDALDDKIQQLNDQNADSVTKQADLDDEYSKKQDDINQQIQDAEADVNKKKIERQTKQQEQSTTIQKAVLKAEKTQFDNLTQINKLNIDKANLQFAIQQITIDFSSTRINKTCRDKVMAMKDALTGATPPPPGAPATAKPTTKKFTVGEAQKIKQDLKLEEQTCLQTEALKKSAQIKGIQDKKVGIDAQVDTLNRSTADEVKSVNIDKQAFEDMKKTLATEEQQEEDAKMKKLNNLSQSLVKFADTVARKKKSLDDRIAARKEQIKNLALEKQQKVDRFGTVSSALSAVSTAQTRFTEQCCDASSTKSSNELKRYCSDVKNASSSSFSSSSQ